MEPLGLTLTLTSSLTHYATLDALLSLPEHPSFICEMGTIILLPVMCGDELESLTESA